MSDSRDEFLAARHDGADDEMDQKDAELVILRGKLAVLESFGRQIQAERISRSRGGADDCYTNNARSRKREYELIEQMIAAALIEWRNHE